MENEEYKFTKRDWEDLFVMSLFQIHLMFTPFFAREMVRASEKSEKSRLEQKTKNEIIIDSVKVETPNYQNSINYLEYKKQ